MLIDKRVDPRTPETVEWGDLTTETKTCAQFANLPGRYGIRTTQFFNPVEIDVYVGLSETELTRITSGDPSPTEFYADGGSGYVLVNAVHVGEDIRADYYPGGTILTAEVLDSDDFSGGSAYPDSVTLITESRELTPADQGIVVVDASGLTLSLPTTAATGTTFKIIAPNGVTIDPNGNDVLGGYNTDEPFLPGRVLLSLMAIDLGAGLSWTAEQQNELRNYSNLATYTKGDMVFDGDDVCLSIADENVGNPVTDRTNWMKFAAIESGSGEIDLADVTDLSGGVTATAAGFEWQKIGNECKLRVLLDISGGESNVGFTIDLSSYNIPAPLVAPTSGGGFVGIAITTNLYLVQSARLIEGGLCVFNCVVEAGDEGPTDCQYVLEFRYTAG